MTEHEEMFMAGHVCLAARRMGIVVHESNQSDSGTSFQWADPLTGVYIKSPPNQDRRRAFMDACQSLVDYLSVKR